MLVFWILAAAMTAVALAFVLVPLLRARPATAPTETEANLEVLRSQRREIDADVAAGTLPADAREEALEELVGRAADDLAEPPPAPVAAARRAWAPALAIALAVPALAFGLYAVLGNPLAADPAVTAAGGEAMDEKKIVEMVERLALKVRERPDDAQGWALLARSMAALERFKESADAYAHLVKLVPNDAQVLADYADALGMAQGRTLDGKPAELVREALRLEPRNKKALALAGTAALDRGDFEAAAGHWRTLAAELPPESQDAQQVQAILADIDERAARSGRKPAAGPLAQAAPRAAASATVSGSVSVAPELAAKLSGGETLFIFARADGGPRAPLAVIRASARELPMKFTLDDTQAMAPGFNISSAQAIRVEARLSKSGNATPQPGDLAGASAVVKPGARDVKVVVDKVLP
jgi:cytochrome c-type biogenesis protein CcmH